MKRITVSRLLALFGIGGVALACNTGGEAIYNPVPDTEIEPNDTLLTATDLDIQGQGGVVEGACESAGALDHFRMTASTSGTASASLNADVQVDLALLSTNGTVIGQGTDTVPPYDVTATVGSGAVTLRVTCPDVGQYGGILDVP